MKLLIEPIAIWVFPDAYALQPHALPSRTPMRIPTMHARRPILCCPDNCVRRDSFDPVHQCEEDIVRARIHHIWFRPVSSAMKGRLNHYCESVEEGEDLQPIAVQQAQSIFFDFETFWLGQSLQIQFSSDPFENMLIRITLKIRSEWSLMIFDAIKK